MSQQPSGGIAASDQSTQLQNGGPNKIRTCVKSIWTNFARFLNVIINFEKKVYIVVNYKIVAAQWASTVSPEKFVETEDIQAAKEEVPS